MAIVSAEKVREGLIASIRDLVGYHLSDLPTTSTEPLKAVIKDRVKGVRPDYPYIVVSTPTTRKTGGAWLRDSKVVEVSEGVFKPSYVTEQTIIFEVNCYGEDAHDILTELRINTEDDVTRSLMNKSTGAFLQYFTEVSYNPLYLETEFIEGYTTTCYFTAVSDWIPVNGTIIDTVELQGTVGEVFNDPNGVPVDIIVDSNP